MVRTVEPQWRICGFRHQFEHGNRLNGGNSDFGGLANVNNWQSDNHNDNIGFRLQIVPYPLTVLIQPPSILPISMVWETKCWYLLLSRHLVSWASLKSIFRRSNFVLIFCKPGNFCSRGKYPVIMTSSKILKIIWSIFSPKVYFLLLGKSIKY